MSPKLEIDQTLERLRDKFDQIRELDRGFQILGAKRHHHRFQLATPGELGDLEAVLGFSLPTQYRSFLLHIGYGAGPFDGLYGPPDHLEIHQETLHFSKAKDKGENDLRDISELTPEGWVALREERRRDENEEYVTLASDDYTLMLCLVMDAPWTTHLVARGPFCGRVVDEVSWLYTRDAKGNCPTTFAAPSPKWEDRGILPTFFEWIEWWADKALADATGHQRAQIKTNRGRLSEFDFWLSS